MSYTVWDAQPLEADGYRYVAFCHNSHDSYATGIGPFATLRETHAFADAFFAGNEYSIARVASPSKIIRAARAKAKEVEPTDAE